MTEVLMYTAVGLLLYGLADFVLRLLEKLHGEVLPHRSLIFFAIITVMALVVFQLIRLVFNADI